MSKKHSASREMIAYLKNYALKRAERKECHTQSVPSETMLSYTQKIQLLEQRIESLQAQKKL